MQRHEKHDEKRQKSESAESDEKKEKRKSMSKRSEGQAAGTHTRTQAAVEGSRKQFFSWFF